MTEKEIRKLIPRERAKEILRSIMEHDGWDHDCSIEENTALKEYWETCPGNWSFFNMVSHLCQEPKGINHE